MTTTDIWTNLPKWQQLLTIIVCGTWYLHQLDHPWLFELAAQMARLLAHLKP
jgi:hypothetical protein